MKFSIFILYIWNHRHVSEACIGRVIMPRTITFVWVLYSHIYIHDPILSLSNKTSKDVSIYVYCLQNTYLFEINSILSIYINLIWTNCIEERKEKYIQRRLTVEENLFWSVRYVTWMREITGMREIPSYKSNNFFFKSPISFVFILCFRMNTNECIYEVWWS